MPNLIANIKGRDCFRALVGTMVFAVVEKAGTVVMTDGEELDSWSVIINGHVEITEGESGAAAGARHELHLGDSFGITPTMEKLFHRGQMRTKCDDCQFVCVTQSDYYRILHQVNMKTAQMGPDTVIHHTGRVHVDMVG